jgi:hypothetical protein
MATSQATYIKDFGETEAEQRFKYSTPKKKKKKLGWESLLNILILTDVENQILYTL